MSIGIFTEKEKRPAEADIREVLGAAYGIWQSVADHVRKDPLVHSELKYLYGKTYGWGLQFRRKGKLLLTLFPNKDYFMVQIILSTRHLKNASRMGLDRETLNAIDAAKSYAEGKWVFVRITGARGLSDVVNLLKSKIDRGPLR